MLTGGGNISVKIETTT